MSVLSKHHKELTNGVGKCSVPMWCRGMPGGFCDNEAYSKQTAKDKQWRELSNRFIYVPALACPAHGGLEKKQALHLCNSCENDFGRCESNPTFGTGLGYDNVYECDIFESNQEEQ